MLLPQTLESLRLAGFDAPRLFVDGCKDLSEYEHFKLPVTLRHPVVKTFGNWSLGIMELFYREPTADRYAMFQDDLITSVGLREYLEKSQYPEKGYQNLFTFRCNEKIVRGQATGWMEASCCHDDRKYNTGRGAVALVFSREALVTLLQQPHHVERPLHAGEWWRGIDGGISNSMNDAGWREYIHNPSLVQHTGDVSTIRNLTHQRAQTFRGPKFDLTTLL